MPRHDPVPRVPAGRTALSRAAARALHDRLLNRTRRLRRRDDDGEGGDPCPVTPDRPLDLSGGAAAVPDAD